MRTTSGISATYEYIADVEPDGGAPAFRVTFKQLFSGRFRNAGIRRPDVGERAPVNIDPRTQKVELDLSALRTERHATTEAAEDSFEEIASAPPGSATPSLGESGGDLIGQGPLLSSGS